jgi:hypothetical protein
MNIMGLPELKNKVLMYIENADENQLVKISDIFENENIEAKSIKELLEVSEKEYLEGKTHSYESVLKESKEKYFSK